MRRISLALVFALSSAFVSACDSKTGGNSMMDMAGASSVDFAGQILDFAGMPQPDLAMPDLAGRKFITIGWQLINKNRQGGVGNGFNVKCDEVGVTQLSFVVINPQTNDAKATKVDCPAGKTIAESTIEIPDAMGPFEVCGNAVGKAMSNSDKVTNVLPSTNISVRVYVEGCDQANCCPL